MNMKKRYVRKSRAALLAALALVALAGVAQAQPKIVISQVYGGGGNSGATYKNDFVELYNAGNAAQNLTGWSVQYAAAAGVTWQVTTLSGQIQPGHYYLVRKRRALEEPRTCPRRRPPARSPCRPDRAR